MLLGIHLTLLIGPMIAVPAPPTLTEALVSASVTNNDSGRSGFQLTFQVGRAGPLDLLDYALVLNPLLRPFNRVVLMVTFNVVPQVLMDGIITNVQLAPSNEPGQTTLTVTGEDVSVMMDMKQEPFPWPAMSADNIVRTIILKYAQYAIAPLNIFPAIFPNPPSPTERVPVQTMTDLNYIAFLGERQGYVFYVEPGPVPNTNIAYWGPPPRASLPQKALSFNMGPATNTDSISFSYNALAPTMLKGIIQDSKLNVQLPVISMPFSTRVPLASQPALIVNQPNVRLNLLPMTPEQAAEVEGSSAASRGRLRFPEARSLLGLDLAEALARAQATVDASTDHVVTVSGQLDALQYGDILRARRLVGVRGVGMSYDGHYYVQSVTHTIRRGEYKQSFTLTREGIGSLTPLVQP